MSVRLKTATTEHIIRITVSRDGDEGVEPDYLEAVIMDGIGNHNAKVRQHGTQDGDYMIEVLGVTVSENLTGRDPVVVLNDNDTYSDLHGSTIREGGDGLVAGDVIFEF